MRTYRDLAALPPERPPAVLALGVFDGVHVGHQAILATARERARSLALVPVACTFDPHPFAVLHPDRAPVPITTLPERLDLLAAAGMEAALVLEFTPELARVEAERFVADIVVEALGAREVVLGASHRFGHRARGTAALLAELGPIHGFDVRLVPPVIVGGQAASSSAIRMVLGTGEVEAARALLGRAYQVAGQVVEGAGRGRTLGFPTANVEPERPVLVPTGVYACRVEGVPGAASAPEAAELMAREATELMAVVNVGTRPTFAGTRLTVEAHVLDWEGDLYGRRIALAFEARLREERRFEGRRALEAQIARDVLEARVRLGPRGRRADGRT